MSIHHLNLALGIEGLRPTEKFILVLLANYADEKGSCYPSYTHIAEKIGLKTPKMVQKAIKKFSDLGLLVIEHRTLENGGYTSNRYHLKLEGVAEYPRVIIDPGQGKQTTSNTKDETKENLERRFNLFWSMYPRKVGKKDARTMFKRVNKKESEKLMYGLKRFIEENKNTEKRYIPHPSTWINQERWNDYFETDELGKVKGVTRENNLNNLAG